MKTVKSAFYDLVSRVITNMNIVLNDEQDNAKETNTKFSFSKKEHEIIGAINKYNNNPNFEVRMSDKKDKHTVYMRPETNDRLEKIKSFIKDNYRSSIKESELTVTETLDFMINSYYVEILGYQIYIEQHPDQKDTLSFDEWLLNKLFPMEMVEPKKEEKKKNKDKYIAKGEEIKKDTAMLKSMVNHVYYLLLNKYLKDEDYVEKDEFLRVGTTENKLSQIAKIDTEVRKASKQQFIDKRRHEMLLKRMNKE